MLDNIKKYSLYTSLFCMTDNIKLNQKAKACLMKGRSVEPESLMSAYKYNCAYTTEIKKYTKYLYKL